MHILSIETSCDETATSVVHVTGDFPTATYEILGNALHSQIDIHKEYGGVFPALAKREHTKIILPMLCEALKQADMLEKTTAVLPAKQTQTIHTILEREANLADALCDFLAQHNVPEIDLIAVTAGPGLEPALWVGVNFAKALAIAWNVPVIPVNHMEGHILASVYDIEADDQLTSIHFPALALLISGGHTELIHMPQWGTYEKIGQTRDDAVGEAFDKVARMMGLSYPGGPAVSKLAQTARTKKLPVFADLPRPMLHSKDLDFSFSGIKTAVRYTLEGKTLTDTDKQALARDFEDAVTEVLVAKTLTAVDEHGIQTVIVGGGVSANQYIKYELNRALLASHPDTVLYAPNPGLSTDNSIMIALAGHARIHGALQPTQAQRLIRANGSQALS